MIEIPLAMTYSQGYDLAELARRRDLILIVGHNHRHNRAIRWARERVMNGDLTLQSKRALSLDASSERRIQWLRGLVD